MNIYLKNKYTLEVDDFQFRCSIGKNGLISNKIEGDFCTPIGKFKLEEVLFRKDRYKKPRTKLKSRRIKKNMFWCTDIKSKNYNKIINSNKKYISEKMYRKDYKYDYVIPLSYNRKKIKKNKGSAIFMHLTKDYKPTAGCIALCKKDFEILIKILKKNSYLKVY